MRNTRLAVFLGLALAGAVATTTVLAQEPATAGVAERGATLADTCMGCHGIDGYRNAYPSYRVPKLGGQHADYIVLALQGYKNQTRPHKTMHAQAVTLSEQDMRDIAAFFASEGDIRKASSPAGTAPAKAATCVACHGEGGVSVAPNWPSLAGQHRDYLEHALNEYKAGLRKDPVMGGQVMALTPADISELAAYFAAQSGLFSVHYAIGAPVTADARK
ncbi:MAG: cytochrome c [Gammaproteobacteria bacterium]|nr:cytochrome c [Gammaproteobacteria bacterium]